MVKWSKRDENFSQSNKKYCLKKEERQKMRISRGREREFTCRRRDLRGFGRRCECWVGVEEKKNKWENEINTDSVS